MKRLVPLFFIAIVIFGCEREIPVPTAPYTDTDTITNSDANSDTNIDTNSISNIYSLTYTGVLDSFYIDETIFYGQATYYDSVYHGQTNSDTFRVAFDSLSFEYDFQLKDTTFQLEPHTIKTFWVGYEQLSVGSTWDSRYTIGFYVDSIVFKRTDLVDAYIDQSHEWEKTISVKGVLYRH